jgi:hypothetical protein
MTLAKFLATAGSPRAIIVPQGAQAAAGTAIKFAPLHVDDETGFVDLGRSLAALSTIRKR